MSQQNKSTLQSAINTQLADNITGDISAADVRGNLINMTDSLLFNTGSAQSITGSLIITEGITGSLQGTATTASYVVTAQTASYVVTAQTASFVVTALTASFVDTARTASILTSTASQAFTASYITGSLFTNSNSAATASFAQTASYIVTAQTASFVTGSNVIGIVSSASLAAGIPTAGMVWNAVGGTPTGYGGSILGNAAFQDNDAGVKLTPNSVGQTGTVNWNLTGSNAFDFTKDFRASFATYYQGTAGAASAGDGHYFYFGGNKTTLKSYGDVDASLTLRYEPYIDGSGSYAYVNGSQVAFNRFFYMGVGSISNSWVNWIIEVKTVPVLAKRFATFYYNSELWPLLQVDVTSWTPGGKTFGVGAWTGAAFANQWCKSAKLQYI